LEQIKDRVNTSVPGAGLQIVPNASVAGQASLLVDNAHALAVARFLRDDPSLRLDYASNVTGIDWLDAVVEEKRIVKQVIEGVSGALRRRLSTSKPAFSKWCITFTRWN
jgi:NADH-quinone oxidoreductase subunit C